MRVCAVEPPARRNRAAVEISRHSSHRGSKKEPRPRQRGSVFKTPTCACEISGGLGKAIWRGSPLS